jgi:hypothetical protein
VASAQEQAAGVARDSQAAAHGRTAQLSQALEVRDLCAQLLAYVT